MNERNTPQFERPDDEPTEDAHKSQPGAKFNIRIGSDRDPDTAGYSKYSVDIGGAENVQIGDHNRMTVYHGDSRPGILARAAMRLFNRR